jgi:hypothetical protein
MSFLSRRRGLRLALLPEPVAICRLPPDAGIPGWATSATHWSVTRTPDELSIVCPEVIVPADVQASRGWRALRVEGPVPLDQTGVLASITGPLAAAHVSLFVLATFDTDYVLIPAAQRNAALAALDAAGHEIV